MLVYQDILGDDTVPNTEPALLTKLREVLYKTPKISELAQILNLLHCLANFLYNKC